MIPSTMAWVFASLSPAISFALIGVIVGEFIGAERGIGRLIIESEARRAQGPHRGACGRDPGEDARDVRQNEAQRTAPRELRPRAHVARGRHDPAGEQPPPCAAARRAAQTFEEHRAVRRTARVEDDWQRD